MAEPPLPYGIVGFGRAAQTYHLPAIERSPRFRLAAVCDVDCERVRPAFADRAVLVTDDLETFFGVDLAAVSVCTPNDDHAPAVSAALAHGRAVLCEKPLAHRIDVAEQLAAVARGGPLAGVNLPYRLHPLVEPLRRIAAGRPHDARLVFRTPGRRLWRPYGRWYDDAARAGGGVLIDLGVHALDMLAVIFDGLSVRSCLVDREPVEDRAHLVLDHAAGAVELNLDRAARRFDMTLALVSGTPRATLDLRSGRLPVAGKSSPVEVAGPVDHLAVEAFLDALLEASADGAERPGRWAGFEDAVVAERIVDRARRVAVVDPAALPAQ